MSWDGKTYDKYRIAHTDGTPLKGKSYFVLRLDSDNPAEAARVNAAMRAYKGRLRNCDVGSELEQSRRYEAFCEAHHMQCDKGCSACPCSKKSGVSCELYWAQMPYEAKEGE